MNIKVCVLLALCFAYAIAMDPLTTYNCSESLRVYFSPVQWVCTDNCVSTPNLGALEYSDWCSNEGCLMWGYYYWLGTGQCRGFGH
jgi:hypothetical protein